MASVHRTVAAVHTLPTGPVSSPVAVARRVAVANPIAPAIVIIVVAVAAFVALAAVIGAVAAYIYYCQSNGLGWPGLSVPGPEGGVYKLGCYA